jgi:hypothetical protein
MQLHQAQKMAAADDSLDSGGGGRSSSNDAATPTDFALTRAKLQRQSASLVMALLRNFVVLPTACHYVFDVSTNG